VLTIDVAADFLSYCLHWRG